MKPQWQKVEEQVIETWTFSRARSAKEMLSSEWSARPHPDETLYSHH